MALLLFVCVLFWGAHKSLVPRARTLLGGLGHAMLSFFAVATLLFFCFCECPKFCDLAKQRRKTFGGVSEVRKDDFSLYFFWLCVFILVFHFSCAAIAHVLSTSSTRTKARARAVGLVTGPHARTPPHPQPVGSGPRQPAQRAGSRGLEGARPLTPHTQARGALPGHPHAAPTARKSARCGVGDGSPRPHLAAPTASE